MFRENVLNNDEVIDRITGTMIPVALDIQEVLNPESNEARFLQPLIKPGKNRRISNETDQGIWVISPKGELLGRPFEGFGNMVQKTNNIIENALKAYGPVKHRKTRAVETHPYLGIGVMSDGSVCLAEYVREEETGGSNIKTPVMSSVILTEDEFTAFAPEEAVRGAEWTLPDAVAKKFCRLTSSGSSQHAPQPDWVTGVQINAEVRKIENGLAWLSYEGSISSTDTRVPWENSSKVKLIGEGVYDTRTQQMRSVLILGSGTSRTAEFPDDPVTINALLEWVLEHPDNR